MAKRRNVKENLIRWIVTIFRFTDKYSLIRMFTDYEARTTTGALNDD